MTAEPQKPATAAQSDSPAVPGLAATLPTTAQSFPHRVPLALSVEQFERLRKLKFATGLPGAEILRRAFDALEDDTLSR